MFEELLEKCINEAKQEAFWLTPDGELLEVKGKTHHEDVRNFLEKEKISFPDDMYWEDVFKIFGKETGYIRLVLEGTSDLGIDILTLTITDKQLRVLVDLAKGYSSIFWNTTEKRVHGTDIKSLVKLLRSKDMIKSYALVEQLVDADEEVEFVEKPTPVSSVVDYKVYVDEKEAGLYTIEPREISVHIIAAAIDPEFRGRNITKQFIDFIADKYSPSRITTSSERSAIPFWEKMGFGRVRNEESGGTYMLRWM